MNLAPNGKHSNLTPEQYRLVRTSAFKKWFGDWENSPKTASKVIDINGEPLVVHHGTKKRFNVFDKSKIDKEWNYGIVGFFFSSSYHTAYGYTEYTHTNKHGWKTQRRNKKNVISVFLNIRNPKGFFPADKSGDGIIEKSNGFYIAFEPNQIKLADGSNDTFDKNNSDIRYSNGGKASGVLDFIANKVGGNITDTNKFITASAYPKLNTRMGVGAGWKGDIIEVNGNRAGLKLQEKSKVVIISKIVVEKKNTGLGTDILNAIIEYANQNNKKIWLEDVVNKKYFKKFGQLEFVGTESNGGTTYELILNKFGNGGTVAYHGSPYEFDQFTTNMVGQGEGASGWGYGIYFSEDKDDAKDYARKLERGKGEGRLYKAKIPNKEHFLDTDKDVDRQSKYVYDAIMGMPKKYKIKLLGSRYEEWKEQITKDYENGEYEGAVGSPEYWESVDLVLDEVGDIGNDFYSLVKQTIGEGYEYEASEFLYGLGIKGNKHKGFGFMNYVVFSDEDVNVIQRTKPRLQYGFSKGGAIMYNGIRIPETVNPELIISAFSNDIDYGKVEEFTEVMKEQMLSHDFPPIWGYPSIIDENDVGQYFLSGEEITEDDIGKISWMVTDGHHRALASINANLPYIEVELDYSTITSEKTLSEYGNGGKFVGKNIKQEINKIATDIFNLNYEQYQSSEYEFSVTIYIDRGGNLKTSEPIIGSESEVDISNVDGVVVGVVHSHPDGEAELSSWDEELGEEMAEKTNNVFIIFVIGYNEEGEIVMTSEAFEPNNNSDSFGNGGAILNRIKNGILIHTTSKENRKSILEHGLGVSKNPVIVNGIYTSPEMWFDKEVFGGEGKDEYRIKLKPDAKILWTDTDRPMDMYYGGGNKQYKKIYAEMLGKTGKTKEQVLAMDDIEDDKEFDEVWFGWKTKFSRELEKYLSENNFDVIQQGGEFVIVNVDSIESVTVDAEDVGAVNKKFEGGGESKYTFNNDIVTFDDFHLSTFANFTKIKNKELPNRSADFISKSGSKYWYEVDSVIRESNHWGRTIASCNWLLNSCAHKGQAQGVCKLSNFIRIKERLLYAEPSSIGKLFEIGKTVLLRNGGGCIDIQVNKGVYVRESSDYYIFDTFKVGKQTLAYVKELE